jgi:hypothetical protein
MKKAGGGRKSPTGVDSDATPEPPEVKGGKRMIPEAGCHDNQNGDGAVADRPVFHFSRTTEYFQASELASMTGQPVKRFPDVILKELVDNGLDAAESLGNVAPRLDVLVRRGPRSVLLAVRDNGAGIGPDTIPRICDFDSRTSSKTAWMGPTRGWLGNALKCVIGIPHALGSRCPVVVQARGVRHTIAVTRELAGGVRVEPRRQPAPDRPGTIVAVRLPRTAVPSSFRPRQWGRGFALFNPHAAVRIREFDSGVEHAQSGWREYRNSYRPGVSFPGGDWRKFLPRDLTSPWWYTAAALARLIGLFNTGGDGARLSLRMFVQKFRGLSRNAAAAGLARQFPAIRTLADFANRPAEVGRLLEVMRQQTKAPAPDVLGSVGEDHFRRLFQRWHDCRDDRFWYKRVRGTADGRPFVVEAALAVVERGTGTVYYGVNFSPSFGDALTDWTLDNPEFVACGFGGVLQNGHAHPDGRQATRTVAAFHLVAPGLTFLDKGKVRVEPPEELVKAAAAAAWAVVKTLYKEEERRKKDAARQERADEERLREERRGEWPLNRAVYHVLPEAVTKATGGTSRTSAHTLYYHVRPLIQPYTSRTLSSDYFEQNLLPAYQRERGALLLPDGRPAIYYESRGTLIEPHTEHELPLGTREVEGYRFPAWLYDKILLVEKTGLWPVLQDAKLAERYDMAIVASEGYATEACRVLFEKADKEREYQLFVLHDADPYGYNIARTLREETRRMPGYKVTVHDLGLKLQDALDLGLATENFTRKADLPRGLVLNELETEYFTGEERITFGSKPSWVCQRVELNAFDNPGLLTYIERGLEAAGARGKLVPPRDVAARHFDESLRKELRERITEQILDEADLDHQVDEALARLAPDIRAATRNLRRAIRDAQASDRTLAWRTVAEQRAADVADGDE